MADLFDFDFSKETISDASPSGTSISGSSAIVHDDELNKNVANFNLQVGDEYVLGDVDFSKISESNTIEMVIKYDNKFNFDNGQT